MTTWRIARGNLLRDSRPFLSPLRLDVSLPSCIIFADMEKLLVHRPPPNDPVRLPSPM